MMLLDGLEAQEAEIARLRKSLMAMTDACIKAADEIVSLELRVEALHKENQWLRAIVQPLDEQIVKLVDENRELSEALGRARGWILAFGGELNG